MVSDLSLLTLSTHFPHSTPASCQLKPDKIYLIIRADRDALSALGKYQVAERAVGQGARWISFGRVTEARSVKASQICCFGGSVTPAEIAGLCRLWCDPQLGRFPELGPQAVRAFYNFNLQQVWQV